MIQSSGCQTGWLKNLSSICSLLSAENGIRARTASLLLCVDVAQRLSKIHDFKTLDRFFSMWNETCGLSEIKGLLCLGPIGWSEYLFWFTSGSAWALAVAHSSFEKLCYTWTWVSDIAWTIWLYALSDIDSNLPYRNWRFLILISSRQVFKSLMNNLSTGTTKSSIFLFRAQNWLELGWCY